MRKDIFCRRYSIRFRSPDQFLHLIAFRFLCRYQWDTLLFFYLREIRIIIHADLIYFIGDSYRLFRKHSGIHGNTDRLFIHTACLFRSPFFLFFPSPLMQFAASCRIFSRTVVYNLSAFFHRRQQRFFREQDKTYDQNRDVCHICTDESDVRAEQCL